MVPFCPARREGTRIMMIFTLVHYHWLHLGGGEGGKYDPFTWKKKEWHIQYIKVFLVNIVWNILCTNHHNIVAVLSLQRVHLTRCHFEISGADPGEGGGTRQNWKKLIFWRKIVIFHTKYPQKFSHLPPLGAIYFTAPPLTWNPGSASEYPRCNPILFDLPYICDMIHSKTCYGQETFIPHMLMIGIFFLHKSCW